MKSPPPRMTSVRSVPVSLMSDVCFYLGMFQPFYIIEVKIKPQQGGILYKAEDGCRYQRMHGSTTNLDHYEMNNVKGFFRQPMEVKVSS